MLGHFPMAPIEHSFVYLGLRKEVNASDTKGSVSAHCPDGLLLSASRPSRSCDDLRRQSACSTHKDFDG